MKKSWKQKAMVLMVAATLTFSTMQCGIILHPERQGQKSGEVDVPMVVLDCLWLIAGVVPGVVALVVDYATGGIYESKAPVKASPGKKMSFRIKGKAPVDANVMVTLVAPEGLSFTLLSQHYSKGEERTNMLTFSLPNGIAPGAYNLNISVNGASNVNVPVLMSN